MVVERSSIIVDLNNLSHNVNILKKDEDKRALCAVVKANAYGHGIKVIAKKLLELGVMWFAISSVDEGVELRKVIGDTCSILIFPDFYSGRWEEIQTYN